MCQPHNGLDYERVVGHSLKIEKENYKTLFILVKSKLHLCY